MNNQQKVKDVYPAAKCHQWGGWRDGEDGYTIHVTASLRFGFGATEEEAWNDAANRLPAFYKPIDVLSVNEFSMPHIERLMPSCSIDSTMRLVPHMAINENGLFIRYEDARKLVTDAFVRIAELKKRLAGN